jgi:hypothetical protein
MARQFAWASGKTGAEDSMLSIRSDTDPDIDIPVLIAARAEYAKLK